MKLTQSQIRDVPCIICDANTGEHCRDKQGTTLFACHIDRQMLADKMPAIFANDKLNATHKALICYYAFIMIADSVSAHSALMFDGKVFTSREVQVFFAKRAIVELQKDGLLE